MARALRAWAINQKRGSVTYSTDGENEVSKIFIISLMLIRRASKETSQSQAESCEKRGKFALKYKSKTKKKAKTQKQAHAHAHVITTLNVIGCFKLHL